MTWLIIWDQLAQNLFLGSRTEGQGIFLILDNFIVFYSLYSTYEILFVKSEARVLDLCYGMTSVWAQVAHN